VASKQNKSIKVSARISNELPSASRKYTDLTAVLRHNWSRFVNTETKQAHQLQNGMKGESYNQPTLTPNEIYKKEGVWWGDLAASQRLALLISALQHISVKAASFDP
jgi:hypothetical protein